MVTAPPIAWERRSADQLVCALPQVRLVELYSELAAPQQALAYQQCYTVAVSDQQREVLDDCAAQVANMKKALKKLKLYPFL